MALELIWPFYLAVMHPKVVGAPFNHSGLSPHHELQKRRPQFRAGVAYCGQTIVSRYHLATDTEEPQIARVPGAEKSLESSRFDSSKTGRSREPVRRPLLAVLAQN